VSIHPSVPEWLVDSSAEFLTAAEKSQLGVLFDRIWPSDPIRLIPGAVEVGAPQFVSRLLARSTESFRDIPKWQVLYRESLKSLDTYTLTQFGKPLAQLDAAQADAVIGGLEAQTLVGLSLPSGASQYGLFDTLRRHCIQGCLSDPRWGGNLDRKMWKALGFFQPAEEL
jgi:gluconate 2-dehydrogenase gamma chain